MLCVCLFAVCFAGCGKKTAESGKVYYLNFKPEQDSAWQQLAADYTNETGVKVSVVTAAQGTYEETLTAEIDKSNAPTLFQVSGITALDAWKDYCLDLSDTKLADELTSDDFALKADGKTYGIAYVYEGFGLITNTALLEKAGYKTDDIKSFDDLKRIAEDIHARRDTLGFDAFTSSTLDSSSSWRFSGHLATVPLYYEFKDDGITEQPSEIKGTYLDRYKALWDLYTSNSTVEPQKITSTADAAKEFSSEKAVFYQNGTWMYNDVKEIGDDNLDLLPIFAGISDENQGICCGTENYWAVNSQASDADKKATLDFLYWVVTSETGTTALADKMGFSAPFKQAKPVKNVLANRMEEYVNGGYENVAWVFNLTPSVEAWRADVVSALAAYTTGNGGWDAVETAFTDGWKKQYSAAHS